MNRFAKNIAPYVKEELRKAGQYLQQGDFAAAFTHLENAHVLGQESTYWHVLVHLHMMRWGLARKDINEILGQFIRIVGAALLTAVKGVPVGNTGGSNISPIKTLPIRPEHAEIIARARRNA